MKILLAFSFLLVCSHFHAQDLNYISHEPHKNQRNEFTQIFTIGEDLNGAIYASGENSKIYKYEDKEWTDFSIPGSNNLVQEITGGVDGQLFVAVQNEGLWIRMNNQWQLYDNDNSNYPKNPIHGGIAWDDKSNTLWLGTNGGLVKYSSDSFTIFNHLTVGVDLIDDEILDLVRDEDGSLWMISKLSTLIHFKDDKFKSQPVGWDLKLFDLSFEKIDIKMNNDIVITTSNNGLLTFDGNEFIFEDDYGLNLRSIAVDYSDNIWLTDESTLWKKSLNELDYFEDPIVPLSLYEIFVSANNHIWLGGQDGPIVEIVQDRVGTFVNELDVAYINLFPNPLLRENKLRVDLNPPNLEIHLSVYSIYGKSVYSGKIVKGEFDFDYSKGSYIFVFESNLGVVVKNVVVK